MPRGVYSRGTPESRFWKFVNKNGPVCERIGTPCWMWMAGKIKGYGYFWLNGKTTKAYHFVYKLFNGPIPTGLCILHECDNPSCVNPTHLKTGTQKDNRQDCVRRGRQALGDAHGSKTRPERVARGCRVRTAVLTDDLVVTIRAIYCRGSKTHDTYGLAKKFGVSQATIWRVVNRLTWTHI